jgi:hypothetical protein
MPNNFAVGIGGSGARLMTTLIHMGASGLFPDHRKNLKILLVDPDGNNGNGTECATVFQAYQECRKLGPSLGDTPLFGTEIDFDNAVRAWTPDAQGSTLEDVFHYNNPSEADKDLLDILYEPAERRLVIHQGFRGRPAIGAAILANSIDFKQHPWNKFGEDVKAAGNESAVLVAGSVFGGSGAAGVPTIARIFKTELTQQVNPKFGLVLFLPYFVYRKVEGEAMQADPFYFGMATSEALKYYAESGFLTFCDSIYTIGEQDPIQLRVPSVGGPTQKNEAHFVELIAGLGVTSFFSDPLKEGQLLLTARQDALSVKWTDLPAGPEVVKKERLRRLVQMARFAVAYQFIFKAQIQKGLDGFQGLPFYIDQVSKYEVDTAELRKAFHAVNVFVEHFLEWLKDIAAPPQRGGEISGLIDRRVFSSFDTQEKRWKLKAGGAAFKDSEFQNLVVNDPDGYHLTDGDVLDRACDAVRDRAVAGPGRLIRAIYDSCSVR